MKKILFILWLVITCISCADHAESLNPSQVGQDGKVKAELSVVVPELQPMSRALGKKPSIENLYLAVFDEAGYLLEYVKATIQNASDNETTYTYNASLSPTSFATTIHFIANGPSSVDFGSETEVIGGLSTSGNKDAYWQKVYLSNGIKVTKNGTNNVLDESVQTKLENVPLIRNFAWIQLEIDEDVNNFTLDSYCVVNTYDKGSVAPYNASKRYFEDYLVRFSHQSLVDNGYGAFIPKDATLNMSIPAEGDWTDVSTDDDADEPGYFIYERESPKANPIYILMKGTYDPNTSVSGDEMQNRYYKIDLRDGHNYFPVLRNFKYKVNISGINFEGYGTASDAAKGVGSGDVSTSIETVKYTNISDGKVRLYVSFMDTTLVSTGDIYLKYKFVSLTNNSKSLNGPSYVTVDPEEDGAIINSFTVADKDDDSGWRTITIAPKQIAVEDFDYNDKLVETITIIGRDGDYSVQRQVKLTLRCQQEFELECDPNEIANVQGSPFDLVIKIPGGWGESNFPLDFYIEAEEQSITPDEGDDLPVETGTSIISGNNKTTIGFIKSVTWREYNEAANVDGKISIRCDFKSNRAASATDIYAQNKYFTLLAPATLGNYSPGIFDGLTFSPTTIPTTVGSKVQFTFVMKDRNLVSGEYVTVTLEGLEPQTGNSAELEHIKGNQYKYTPNGTLKLYLQTTTSCGRVSVNLEAPKFTTNKLSKSVGQYVIDAKCINVGGYNTIPTRNTTFSLYASDPGSRTDVTAIASFSASRNGENTQLSIDGEYYQDIVDNNGRIYIRFSTNNFWETNYYVATISLSELEKGKVTIADNAWAQR